jgi:hypothetical protein
MLRSGENSITLSPDSKTKVGPYFGWRWIFLGYTFDIKNIGFSKGGLKKEFDLSIYSSQVGVDLYYRRTGSDYKIRDVEFGNDSRVALLEGMPFDGATVGMTGVNAYYIFNHKRFSYPAAFAQSTCQKVSCGSWMAGAGYTKNTIEFDYAKLQDALSSRMGYEVQLDSGMMFRSIQYKDFSLSAGYAYNFVLPHHWVIGACLQGAVGYKESAGSSVAGPFDDFRFENLNIDGIGRLGVVYNNMRWYAGLNVVVHTYNYHKSRFSTNNTFGSMNLYVGYNFGLKKKYRKEKK